MRFKSISKSKTHRIETGVKRCLIVENIKTVFFREEVWDLKKEEMNVLF